MHERRADIRGPLPLRQPWRGSGGSVAGAKPQTGVEGARLQVVNPEPRQRDDYSPRQIEAAHRVLVDIGQVLASFSDCVVVVGGWVPDLLLTDAEEPHIGSIDVDLALDAAKLSEGRYAELLKLLLDTKRYRKGAKA